MAQDNSQPLGTLLPQIMEAFAQGNWGRQQRADKTPPPKVRMKANEQEPDPVVAANNILNNQLRSKTLPDNSTAIEDVGAARSQQLKDQRAAQFNNFLIGIGVHNNNQMDPYVALQKLLDNKTLSATVGPMGTTTNYDQFAPIIKQLQDIEAQRRSNVQRQYPQGALGRMFQDDPLTQKYIQGGSK